MRWTFHFPRRRVAGISYFPGRYFSRGLRVRISCRGQIERMERGRIRTQSKKRKLARCVHIAHPTRHTYSIAPRYYSLKTHKLLVDFRMHILLYWNTSGFRLSREQSAFDYHLRIFQRQTMFPHPSMRIFTLKWFRPNIFSSIYQKLLEIENCNEYILWKNLTCFYIILWISVCKKYAEIL